MFWVTYLTWGAYLAPSLAATIVFKIGSHKTIEFHPHRNWATYTTIRSRNIKNKLICAKDHVTNITIVQFIGFINTIYGRNIFVTSITHWM